MKSTPLPTRCITKPGWWWQGIPSASMFSRRGVEGGSHSCKRGHLSRGSLNSPMDTQQSIFRDPCSLVLGHRHQHSRKVPHPTPGCGIYWFLSETWLFSLQWSHTCQQLCLSPLLVCKSCPLRENRGPDSLNPQRYPNIRSSVLQPVASTHQRAETVSRHFLTTGPILAVSSGSPFPHNPLKLWAVTQCGLLLPS